MLWYWLPGVGLMNSIWKLDRIFACLAIKGGDQKFCGLKMTGGAFGGVDLTTGICLIGSSII